MSDSFGTPWTVAYQALQSMGFFRQEYWSGLPFPSPGDLPDPGVDSTFPALQVDRLLVWLPSWVLSLITPSRRNLLPGHRDTQGTSGEAHMAENWGLRPTPSKEGK